MKNVSLVLYKFSSMDRSSQILLFLIILVFFMLISISIINFIIKRKNDKYDISSKNIKRYSNLIEKDNMIDEIKNDEEEIEQLDIEDEVIEIVSKKNSIEEISKLIEDTLETEPIDLTSFEEEQEKDAIISYDELVKKAGAKKIVYKAEEKKEEPIIEIKKEENNTTFKASKIVSPVFGIQKEKNNDNEELFIDLEEFENNNDEEIKSDMEFLGSLKTFRSNLD